MAPPPSTPPPPAPRAASPGRPTLTTPETAIPATHPYDVVVIGGALAGAATAILLKRRRPQTRVLLVERQERFGSKVGEATVETSAYFLEKLLGVESILQREHIPKHGLRFWFTDRPGRRLDEMTELGPHEPPRLPSWQLDRARFDESLWTTARELGCELLRPAKVTAVELGWPASRLSVECEEGGGPRLQSVTARWVVDASGRQAFLARRLRLLSRNEKHPTMALWGRWHGAASLDGPVLAGPAERPRLPPIAASRRQATNHFCGYGWWCWVIPLASGATSVGLVFHKELFELPGEGTLAERYRDFVTSQPGLAELLAPATFDADDFHSYSHLPYRTARYAERGWALVGDAASFMDPYYSPGLDHAAMSVYATVRLIEDDLSGELDPPTGLAAGDGSPLDRRIEEHDRRFQRSYERWLEALYLGKYELLGDAELTGCAYLVDTALYYLGIVTPIYHDPEALANPSFSLTIRSSELAYRLMRLFNRRMNRLARLRLRTGTYGRRNAGWRHYGVSPGLGREALPMLWSGLTMWLRLEARHRVDYLRHLLRRGRPDLSCPLPHTQSPWPLPEKGAPLNSN